MDSVVNFARKFFSETEKQPLLDTLKRQRAALLKRNRAKPLIGKKVRMSKLMCTPTAVDSESSSSTSISISSETDEEPVDKNLSQNEQTKQLLKQLLSLFHYVTVKDKCILLVGTFFAILHGASFPVLALLFGSMSNAFIGQYGQNSTGLNSTEWLAQNTTAIIPNNEGMTNFTGNAEADAIIGDLSKAFRANFFHSGGKPLSKDEFSDYVANFSLYYVYIGLGVFVASFLQTACWEWAAENQMYHLRQEFTYQMIRQEMSWFDKYTAGALVIKLADDCERVREGLGHKFSMVIEYAAIFGFGALFGLLTSWRLTLTFMSSTPLILAKVALLWKSVANQSKIQQTAFGKAGAISAEVLTGMRTVTAFSGELKERNRYSHALDKGVRAAIKKYYILGVGTGIMCLLIYGFYAVAFWYGVNLLAQHAITAGDIYTVFFSVTISTFALGSMLPFVSSIGNAYGSASLVRTIIQTVPNIDPYSEEGIIPKKLYGRIKFSEVSFKYPSRKDLNIFNDFSFTIFGGQTIAIVGPSGSGKTTLTNLLLRFYDPQQGNIRLDNYDLKSLNVAWLRSQFSVVPQNAVFFRGTVFDNIRCGRTDIKLHEVVKIAKFACAHDFIVSLPKFDINRCSNLIQGYSTIIGISGKQLSTGQRQRLAITRALIQNTPILILDEALAAVDKETAAVIEANLERLRKGKTTIVIAHRLSTIRNSDFIFVMKDGSIVESGTHNSLVAQEGLYYQMSREEELLQHHVKRESDELSKSASEESSEDSDFEREQLLRGKSKRRDQLLPPVGAEAKEESAVPLQYPSIGKVLGIMRGERCLIIMGLIGCGISGCIIPLLALYLGQIFATFTKTGQELLDSGWFWTKMLAALAVGAAIGYFFRTVYINSAGEYFTLKLRMYSYLSILRQPISWYDSENNSPARLYTRLACDVPFVKTAVGSRLGTALSAIVSITAATIISFIFGWQLALITLAILPLLFTAIYVQVWTQKGGQQKLAQVMEDIVRLSTRTIQDIWTVQTLSRALDVCEKFEDLIFPALLEGQKQALIYGLAFAFSESIIFLVFGAAFRLGAELIRTDVMEAVDLFTVFFAVAFASLSLGQVTSFIPEFLKARLSAASLFKLIDLESPVDPLDDDGDRPEIKGGILFKDVVFSYPLRPEFKVLQGVNLEIPEGLTLGIVGTFGGGKSTILSLLERFYEIDSGEILIDGVNIKEINLKYLRDSIAYVPQEPNLFDQSIKDNIAYGFTGEATKAELRKFVEEAAGAANADNFIEAFTKNYDRECGERGSHLTGGQRQRIAVARALIRNSKILLLDDPTSAVDVEEEKIIQATLERARLGRTCIVVSSRPGPVRNCDLIAVLVRGRVSEFGPHADLMALNGFYSSFVKQYNTEADEAGPTSSIV